jgi:hypothetical protein
MEAATQQQIESAKQTFLFDFIKAEMLKLNTEILTQDIVNTAYRKTVEFLSNEENLSALKKVLKNKTIII